MPATLSPNVLEAQRLLHENPSIDPEELRRLSTVVPGVLTWADYLHHREVWDEAKQAAGLDAKFYEGREIRLFPDDWLNRATELERAIQREDQALSHRTCLGVDPAEGGDNTAWAVVNGTQGLIELRARRTSDTTDIPNETLAIMREYRIEDHDSAFDRGGGGKIHADVLRRKGHNVRTVAFGDPPFTDPTRGLKTFGERVDIREERYAFRNLRAQMYFELSLDTGFPIPAKFLNRNRITGSHSLRHQLSKMPRLLDDDGCYWLPSKGNQTEEMKKRNIKTLTQIIGCSPDEADALVIAHHILRNPQRRRQAGAA